MKRAIFAVLVTMFPLAVAAQDTAAAPPAGTDTTATTSTADVSTPDASQYAPARRGGRRPSMVGYIEDATVGSNFRIRYESGWDIDSPDRAEFFYAKCGCYRTLPPSSAAYDPSAPGPGPGIVQSLNYSQLYLLTEHNVGPHASVFVELPYRWIKPTDFVAGTGSFSNESGLADIRFGTKLALVSAPSHDITLMVRASIPTGDSTKGLGLDHGSFEPALLVRQTLGSRVQLEGRVRRLPSDGQLERTGLGQRQLRRRRPLLRHRTQLRRRVDEDPPVRAGRRAGRVARAGRLRNEHVRRRADRATPRAPTSST